jgi:hypothetical protein
MSFTEPSSAQPKNDSSTKAEIVLLVIETVGDFSDEVLSLYRANSEVLGHREINAAPNGHREVIFRAQFANPSAGKNAPKKDVSEWRKLAATKVNSGPEELGKRSSSVSIVWHVIAGQISHNAKQAVRVVLELTTAAVSVERSRRGEATDVGVYIKARVIKAAICLKFGRFRLRPHGPCDPQQRQ